MKEIKLKGGDVALVDDEDYDFLSQFSWGTLGYRDGCIYATVSLVMHRVIMKPKSNEVVDHIDGNGLNNTKENLELVSAQVNVLRRKRFPRNKLGYRGVSKSYGKYTAKISKLGTDHWLGTFNTIEEAAAAYDKAAIELFGDEAPKSKIAGWTPPKNIAIEDLRKTLQKVGAL